MFRCSGDLLPPSPPAEKATASKDQARQVSTGDGTGDSRDISSLRSQKSKQLDRCIGEWPRQRGRADDQWLARSILSTFDASARRCRSDHLEALVPLLILQQLATRIPENY
jgi:hypothetical protein